MIAVCDSLWSGCMTNYAVTPSRLFALHGQPKETPSKRGGKRWLYGETDGSRKLAGIVAMHGVVLDVDGASVSLATLTGALADVWSFTYSTWSATETAPRWRIIVPLDRPVTVAEYARVWRAVASIIEPVAAPDYGARDASHVWSAPAKQKDGWFACEETAGAVFSVADALERFPEHQVTDSVTRSPAIHSASRYARGALLRAADAVASSQPGERNRVLNQQAFPLGRFVQTGELLEDEIVSVLSTAAIGAGMPPREALYTARRSVRERLRRAS